MDSTKRVDVRTAADKISPACCDVRCGSGGIESPSWITLRGYYLFTVERTRCVVGYRNNLIDTDEVRHRCQSGGILAIERLTEPVELMIR